MRIAIFGTFDVENYGDLILPLVARDRLRDLDAEIVAVSPVGGPPVWGDCLPSLRSDDDLGPIDGVLVGGGDIVHAGAAGVDLYRGDGLTALLAYPGLWLEAAVLADSRGVPLIWNAPGVPATIDARLAPALQKATADAAYVSVRDHGSRMRLEASGVTRPVSVVPDPGLDVARIWTDAELAEAATQAVTGLGAAPDEGWVAVHVTERHAPRAAEMGALLDAVADEQGCRVLLLALGPCHGDDAFARAVSEHMSSAPLVIDRPASLRQLTGLIRGARAYVGSSLHGFVTASAFGVPALVVAEEGGAHGKVSGFTHQLSLKSAFVPDWSTARAALAHAKAAPRSSAEGAVLTLDRHWQAIRQALQEPATRRPSGVPGPRRGELPVAMVAHAATQLLEELDRAEARARSFVDRLAEAEAAAREAREGAAQAGTELEHTRTTADAATQRAQELEQEVGHIRELAERERRALEHALTEQRAVAEAALGHTRELEAELERIRSAHERLQAETTAAAEARRAADQRAEEAERERQALDHALTEQRSAAEGALGHSRELEAELERVRGAHARLQAEVSATEEARKAAGHRAEEAEKRADAATRALSDREAETEALLADLQGRLGDAERRATDAETAHEATLQALSASQAAIDEMLLHAVTLESLAEGLENSHAWRLGRRITKLGRLLTFRRPSGDAAPALVWQHAARAADIAREASKPRRDGPRAPARAAPRPSEEAASADAVAARPADTSLGDAVQTELAHARAFHRTRREALSSADATQPPRDHLGRLQSAAEPRDSPSVDVVICVRHPADDLHDCLRSLLATTDERFGLVIVDDGTESHTAEYLARFASINPAVRLLSTSEEKNQGPAVAANIGLRATTADYVVLLNSDTVVTTPWLTRILAAGEGNARLGILGPLSNAATHQSVPAVREAAEWATNELPAWASPETLALALERLSGERVAPVPFLDGFCYVIRRPVIDAVGLLDEETFADGSAEDDYSCRAAEAGFQLGVVCGSYVFHRGSRSWGHDPRGEPAKTQYRRFLDKHGERKVRRLVEDLDGNAQLAAVRERLERVVESPAGVVSALPSLRITYLVPDLDVGGSGDTHAVVQEAVALAALGVDSRVVLPDTAMDRARAAHPEAGDLLVGLSELAEVSAGLGRNDVVVATDWRSVTAALSAADGTDAMTAFSVQDYAPLSEPADSDTAVAASATYGAPGLHTLYARTDWLCDLVSARHHVPVARAEPSIDPRIFHANGRTQDPTVVRVAAMLRPGTPPRAAATTLEVLSVLHDRCGDAVRISTFGCPSSALEPLGGTPPWCQHAEVLSQEAVGDLLRDTDIFIDCSWYQAFGRTALEAMACGSTAVVPRLGGASSFTRDGHNGLVVDTLRPSGVVAAVAGLVEDADRLRALQHAASATAKRLTPERSAMSQYVLLARAWLGREEPSLVEAGVSAARQE